MSRTTNLRRWLDPSDLLNVGYVDRDRVEDGDWSPNHEATHKRLMRRFWYRRGWFQRDRELRRRKETWG